MPKAQQYSDANLRSGWANVLGALGPSGAGLLANLILAGYNATHNEARFRTQIGNSLAEEFGITPDQALALYDQYKGKGASQSTFWDYLNPANWFNGWGDPNWQTDWSGLDQELSYLQKAYDELGAAPERLSAEEMEAIRQAGYDEIDAENQKLLDLYNQSFQNSQTQLQNELLENSAMFGDYRNQILTNEAMRQQAIAGSTRYELDRQQRNAITRGASAAQRLVANINTQLGLQAQSAQQSLDTSNALAQNLLAHRQAQQGIRNSYLDAQNRRDSQLASVYSGQSERRFNYGQSKVDAADSDRERAYQSWLDRKDDYFNGHSTAAGIYGSGRQRP